MTRNAFNWQTGEPSVFASDPAFAPRPGGKSTSEVATETVAKRTKELGRSPGHVPGLADKPRKQRKATHYKGNKK